MHVVRATGLTSITPQDALTLSGVNLTVEKGAVFGLAGPAEAGKSQLLRLILGLQPPADGALLVLGEPAGASRADLRRRVGYVATRAAMPAHLTVTRFLEFSGELAALPRRSARRRLARLAEELDLVPRMHARIRHLRDGERARVAIAAALMSDPELLLLDAPTQGLPPTEAQRISDLVRSLAGPDRTIIIASRRLDELERICTDIAVLNAGRVLYQGPARELRQLARQIVIRVEVDGHVPAFERALSRIDEPGAVHIERRGAILDITALGPHSHTEHLRAIVEAAERTGVELVRIDAGGRDLTAAYLDRLEADRRDGSLRAAAWAASALDALEAPVPAETPDAAAEQRQLDLAGDD
jgi:ABC-2 type transport system ATP-binding protein